MRIDELTEEMSRIPRVPLATKPTTLHLLPSFSREVGAEIWIKRDDLTGLALGGNKVRKLEFLLADAEAEGADTLVTVGGAQSNHARTVAAGAVMRKMECHLVLAGDPPAQPTGNVLLDGIFGAHLHFVGTDDWDELEKQADELSERLLDNGRVPYTMPIGGSTAIGALGFVDAFLELTEQCDNAGIVPSHVIHATSSGGTQAGLEAARRLLGLSKLQIVGVSVAKTAADLAYEVSALVGALLERFGSPAVGDGVEVLGGYKGPGYAAPTPGAQQAFLLLSRSEGIPTDPVYSAKALHALVDVARGLEGPLVFWHTGGLPALFSDEQRLMDWNAIDDAHLSRGGET